MTGKHRIEAVVLGMTFVAIAWTLWPTPETSESDAAIRERPKASAVASADVEGHRPEVPMPDVASPPAPDTAAETARLALIESDPELRDRARQQRLAAAADARWTEAVDTGEYSADDLDPAIRHFFSDVELEPRYREGGAIEGLVIRGLKPEHPLATAGFRVGDRLSRVQGVALDDPAAIPSLLARLGPHFSICSVRAGRERCAEMALD